MTEIHDSNIVIIKNVRMLIRKNRKNCVLFLSTLLLLLAIIAMSSCNKEYISLGSNFVDNNTTNLILVDSSTVELSSVYVDSFATSGTGYLFTGNYNDPQFGKITTESYSQLGVPTGIKIPIGSTFDSVEVILRPNKSFYGDSTIPYSIIIHQLSDPFSLGKGQSYFYNVNSLAYNQTGIGSKTLTFSPSTTDTISVKLSQAVGQDLFDKLSNNAEEIQSNEQFSNYFKGLAFTGSAGNNMIVGFNDSVILRLHYKEPSIIVQESTIDFNITNTNSQFTHIYADRTGTPLASLSTNNLQLFSGQTGNKSFSQYVSGVVTKIRFPFLRDLLNLPNYVKIISAQLVIKPVANSYSSFYTLPPQLSLSTTDQYNQPGPNLSARNPITLSTTTEYGDLVIDWLYGTGTQYTYDVTSYLQQQIAISQNNQNGLLLLPYNPTSTFDRVILGDNKNTQSKTQLKVYYASVQ
ncbi:MAG: DUF4270 domain-containing protein [Bacteroidota bacterium]|nr:DUF4270 domain-containing protein [Bacteroidota bacterium]